MHFAHAKLEVLKQFNIYSELANIIQKSAKQNGLLTFLFQYSQSCAIKNNKKSCFCPRN